MLDIVAIGSDKTYSNTVNTGARITAVRPCSLMFYMEGLGIDPVGNKLRLFVYRGSTGGTPGSAITPQKRDSTNNEAVTVLATFADIFTNENAYAVGTLIDELTMHNQYHRPSEWYRLNTAETLDIRGQVHTAGNVPGFLKVRAFG